MSSHPIRDGAEFFSAAEPEPQEDRRAVAMAREYCRMLRLDPDELIESGRRREPRYRGCLPTMRVLMAAADSVTGVTRRPGS